MVDMRAPDDAQPYAVLTLRGDESLRDLDSVPIMQAYRSYGALLFRGARPDLDEFRDFTSRFCASSVFNESPDRRVFDAEHNIQSVNGGADAFPLHPELSREPWKPDAAFFHCLQAPNEGGETTICDGAAIVRALPDALRDLFAAQRLMYPGGAPPEILRFWFGTESPTDTQLAAPPADCPYRFVREPEGIWRYFTRPLIHRTMFGGELAFGNFLLFARDYLGRSDFPVLADGRDVPEAWVDAVRQVAQHLTVPIRWRDGDLLMLDNSRFMHGRRPIADPSRRLIATFFGYLRDARPDPEEPPQARWRRAAFRPPQRQPGSA